MAPAIGEPAQRGVAHHLAHEQERGEDTHVGGGGIPRSKGVDRVEAVADRADHPERPRREKPREVRIPAEEHTDPGEILAQRHCRRRGGRGRLANDDQRGERKPQADGGAHEAQTVAGRRRDHRQDARRHDAGDQAARAGREVRESKEASAQRDRDDPPDQVHPRRHERPADPGDDQQHQEHQAERQRRSAIGEEERGQRQHDERHALPDRVAHEERQLPLERLGVAGGEQGRHEPAKRHDRRDGADDDVGRAEIGREGRQDRGLRGEREPHDEERVVGAERHHVVAEIHAHAISRGGCRASRAA